MSKSEDILHTYFEDRDRTFVKVASEKRRGLTLTYWRVPERVIDTTNDREALAVATLRQAARKHRSRK